MPTRILLFASLSIYLTVCSTDTVSIDIASPTLKRSARWGDQLDRTATAGESLSFDFIGIALSVQLSTFSTYGLVNMTLDGGSKLLDTYSPAAHVGSVCALCVKGLPATKHSVTLKLVGPGQGHTESGRAWIRIQSISYETAPPSDTATSDPSSPTSLTPSSGSSGIVTSSSQRPPQHSESSSASEPRSSTSPTLAPSLATPSVTSRETSTPAISQSQGGASASLPTSHRRGNAGVIAGAAVAGALSFIALVAAAFIWQRCCRRRPVRPYNAGNESTSLPLVDVGSNPASPQAAVPVATTQRRPKPSLAGTTDTSSSSAAETRPVPSQSETEELRAEVAELRQIVGLLAAPPLYA